MTRAGIAAERGDVVAHPLQREHEVELPGIAAVGKARADPCEVEIAEHVQPVVDRDHHDVAAPAQPRAVADRVGRAAERECAAVDIDHHRQARTGPGVGRPDVEEQAIFRLRPALAALGTYRTEGDRPDRFPTAGSATGAWKRAARP